MKYTHSNVFNRLSTLAKVLILSFMVALFGCQTENLNPSEVPQKADGARKELKTSDVKFNGEYLEFKNHLVFNEFVETVPTQNRAELDAWEQKVGFKSLRNYYEQAIDENSKYYDWLRKNMTQEIANEIKQKGRPHAKFVKTEAAEALVFDEKNNFEMNVYDPRLAALINKEGLVQVGQYLFQYTLDYIKVMPIANKGKVKALKEAKTDNPAEKITVKKIERVKQDANKGGRVEYCTNYFYGDDWDDNWHYYWGNREPWPFGERKQRRIKGSLHIQYTSYPIYECVKSDLYRDCVDYQIIGWASQQVFTAYVQQWELTEVYAFVPLAIWEAEARTTNLRIYSDVQNFIGQTDSKGGDVANLYLVITYSNDCKRAYGEVNFRGDVNSSVNVVVTN